jgi:hypothetical protein
MTKLLLGLSPEQTHTPELWQKTVNLKPELVEGWRFS